MTQRDEIRSALKSGARITQIAALRDFGCFRLAARIDELRKEGLPIVTETIHERGKSFARYSLEQA